MPTWARDDLYGRLKALPLGDGALLSPGADMRERVEASDVMALGLRGRAADGYDLHRLLVYGDLRLSQAVRVFVQLGDHDEVGRTPGPAPLDLDRLDLSQGFGLARRDAVVASAKARGVHVVQLMGQNRPARPRPWAARPDAASKLQRHGEHDRHEQKAQAVVADVLRLDEPQR